MSTIKPSSKRLRSPLFRSLQDFPHKTTTNLHDLQPIDHPIINILGISNRVRSACPPKTTNRGAAWTTARLKAMSPANTPIKRFWECDARRQKRISPRSSSTRSTTPRLCQPGTWRKTTSIRDRSGHSRKRINEKHSRPSTAISHRHNESRSTTRSTTSPLLRLLLIRGRGCTPRPTSPCPRSVGIAKTVKTLPA